MKRPRVSANMAISLDGKISTRTYTPATFTSSEDTNRLLRLRLNTDAILVGRGTLEADSMTMTVPPSLLAGREAPIRCVVSHKGVFDKTHPLFQVDDGAEIILFSIGVESVDRDGVVRVDSLSEMLEYLHQKGIEQLHCEGGGELLGSLLARDYVDTFYLTWRLDKLFGGEESPTVSGKIAEHFSFSKRFILSEMQESSDAELFLVYSRMRD